MQVVVSFVLLLVFAALATVDGLYLHLWKYRLHTRIESRREHLVHTLNSFLFVALLVLFYAADRGGAALWAGVLLLVLVTAVELFDMWIERTSRRGLGGLRSFEYVLHGAMLIFRTASVTLILAPKPSEAWYWSAPWLLQQSYGRFADFAVAILMPGALGIAALHLWLAQRRYLVGTAEAHRIERRYVQ